MKSLSLGCLAAVTALYPQSMLIKVHLHSSSAGELQDCKDVMLYTNHSDPQLRGGVALLIANFISSTLTQSAGRFDKWIKQYGQKGTCNFMLLDILVVCCRDCVKRSNLPLDVSIAQVSQQRFDMHVHFTLRSNVCNMYVHEVGVCYYLLSAILLVNQHVQDFFLTTCG